MLDTDKIIEFESTYERTRRVWSVNLSDKNKYMEMKDGTVPLFMCAIGTTSFLVDCEGFLNPCNKLRSKEYNLVNVEFDDAWKVFQEYPKLMASKDYACAKCKNISICNPCPAHNILSTGNLETPPNITCELTQKRADEFSKSKYEKYILEYKNYLKTR